MNATQRRRRPPFLGAGLGLLVAAALFVVALPAAASGDGKPPTKTFWKTIAGELPATKNGKEPVIEPERFRALGLDAAGLAQALDAAPAEDAGAGLVLSLPAPDGSFQGFRLEESPVMEPELAARHPEIKTYRGVGIDDPAATIRADLTPLGFHASVRSPSGGWYIDPYYHLDQSVYASYYTKDVEDIHAEEFVEREGDAEVLAAELEAADIPAGPATVLRTYRLAMITNPGYANYFGGPANVTAAKVTLVNRVTQIYEDETSIRLVLIADTDKTNLDTAALATGANGPCGNAACYTAAQLSSCSSSGLSRTRIVLGQLVGASNYDIGHLALGNPGGGVASLGVVGGNNKAQGCTGLAAPVGDFFAVDYVAHEMGHQFAGNHTFNGTQSNCSGGNRSAANSVEPGSGSSIMAYAGICGADNTQTNTDPYWSQRSYQEITAYVTSSRPAINEVQTASLRGFSANGSSFRITYGGEQSAPIVRGVNYTAAGIAAAIQGIPGWPGGTVAVAGFAGGTFNDDGFQVTFNSAPLAATNVSQLGLTDFVGDGVSGFVGETAKGGPIDNQGWTVTPTGNHAPVVTVPAASYTIPVRTPLALTGSATDSDGDVVTYLWEQNDRGAATGTALQTNTKTNGPLFRVFGTPLQRPPYVPTEYYAQGENHPTTDPTRVLPDLVQILNNRTNAVTGTCPAGDVECFSEFLPTSAYVGFAGVNADPARLNFRLTARDNRGGVGRADVALVLAHAAGPFLVTSHAGGTASAGSTQTVTWDVAGTDAAPVNVSQVKISLSTDGGLTYPHVLAAATANDGSEAVTLPQLVTSTARIKVEALGNVFFDLSDANLAIEDTTPPELSLPAPIVVNATGPSGALVTYVVTATDNVDPNPDVVCSPASGTTFPIGTTTVACTATDASGNSSSGSFTVHVKSALEQLTDLRAALAGVPPGTSLESKIRTVISSLGAGNLAQACSMLRLGFPEEVRAQRDNKLTAAQADGFLSDAARIAAVLGC